MKEFDVTITETLKLTVSVEASSKEEAQQMVPTFVGNLTLLGESVVPCLQDLRSNERNQIEVDLDQYYPVYRARSKSIIKPSQVRYVLP